VKNISLYRNPLRASVPSPSSILVAAVATPVVIMSVATSAVVVTVAASVVLVVIVVPAVAVLLMMAGTGFVCVALTPAAAVHLGRMMPIGSVIVLP